MNETKPLSIPPLPEQPEGKPKKMVTRNVAIVLGTICIILVAGLVGATAYYTDTINDKNSQLNTLQSEIASVTGGGSTSNVTTLVNQLNATINQLNARITQLQTWLSGNITVYNNYVSDHSYTNEEYQNLQTQISDLNSQIYSLVTQITNLQSQVNDLTSIANLSKSTVWMDAQTLSQPAGTLTNNSFAPTYAGYVTIYLQDFEPTRTDSANLEVSYLSHGVIYDSGRKTLAIGSTAYFPVLPTRNLKIGIGNGYVFGNGANETVTITYYY